jgi:DNA ligase-1
MMLLADLVATSNAVASTRSRSAKVHAIADLLRRCYPVEVGPAALWLSGETGQGRLGIGPAQVRAALERSIAAATPRLGLLELDRRLAALAAIAGGGSKVRRAEELGATFAEATNEEQQFLAKLILGELRQGALVGLLLDGIARAAGVPLALVRRAQMLSADLRLVAETALRDGASGLAGIGLRLLHPIEPMLAQPAEDIDDALARIGTPILDYKLDGARVQVHKCRDEVRVFSRQGNDVTIAVPEAVAAVAASPARELIIDGETLALDGQGRPLPFQTTMRRFGRHSDDPDLRARLPLTLFAFDCLHRDGETLIDAGTRERHAALADTLPPHLIIPRLACVDTDTAAAFLAEALALGHEGIMVKDPTAPYAAGGRGGHWLKVKQAHTLDLVVLAAEWGSGRRRGWLSNLHLGARDDDGRLLMLGKTFKGLTDATLTWQTERLLALEIARDGNVVHVRPELVVEIAFNELQQSHQYPAGLALRFARVKRYRPDKTAADADHIGQVRAIFERQLAYRERGAAALAASAV